MSSPAVPEVDTSPADPAVVTVEALRFRYPRSTSIALAIDHLQIDRGERLFVHGPSGSGKSTLLSVLAGVLLADSGSVRLLGADWGGLGVAARDRQRGNHVGYIFQQFNLLPWLPVIDNAILACRFSRRRAARARARDGSVEAQAARWLEALGLGPDRWGQPAATLSVGEQQRVAAARALMGEPELLLADEPTSALDTARRDEFMALLLAACKEAQTSLVFVSHDPELARYFDRSLRLGAN